MIIGFILFRPFLGSYLLLRLGEIIVFSLASLQISLSARRIRIAISFLLLPALIFLLALLSLLFSKFDQKAEDYFDAIRVFFPVLLFLFGWSLKPPSSGDRLKKFLYVILSIQAFLVLIQEIDLFGARFDLIFNVHELSDWDRSAGSFSNHLEPGWLIISILCLSYIYPNIKVNYLLFMSIVIFAFTASKATMLVGLLAIFLNFSASGKLSSKVYGYFIVTVIGAILIYYTPYFSNTIYRLFEGAAADDPSTRLRWLDIHFVYSQLVGGNNILIGFGKSSGAGDFSYMGTSLTMWIFRYGLIACLLYYGHVYLLIRKALPRRSHALKIFILVLFFNSISNADEALKGLTLFYFLLGYSALRTKNVKSFISNN